MGEDSLIWRLKHAEEMTPEMFYEVAERRGIDPYDGSDHVKKMAGFVNERSWVKAVECLMPSDVYRDVWRAKGRYVAVAGDQVSSVTGHIGQGHSRALALALAILGDE